MYEIAILTYVIALSHFSAELLVFKTAKVNAGFMSPLIVAGMY